MKTCTFPPMVLLAKRAAFPLEFPEAGGDSGDAEIPEYRIFEHLHGLPVAKRRGRPAKKPVAADGIPGLVAKLRIPEHILHKANAILEYGNCEMLEAILAEELTIEAAYREVSIQFRIAEESKTTKRGDRFRRE